MKRRRWGRGLLVVCGQSRQQKQKCKKYRGRERDKEVGGEREGRKTDVEAIRVGRDYKSSYPLALLRSEVPYCIVFFASCFFLFRYSKVRDKCGKLQLI